MEKYLSLEDTAGNVISICVTEDKEILVHEKGDNRPARHLISHGRSSRNSLEGKGAGYGFMLLTGNSLSCMDQTNYEKLLQIVQGEKNVQN